MRITAARRRILLHLVTGGLIAGGWVAVAAAQPPARAPPVQREKPQRIYRPLVVIDPGHGGIDPGAIGTGEVFEKYITFATAVDLAGVLRASRRFRVTLDRGPEEYVPLRERVARAEALRADLFLSLHADALPNPAMRGLSVFTLSATASDREAAVLAASENRDIVAGFRLTRQPREVEAVLIDLVRRGTDNQSLELARDVVAAMRRQVKLLENPQRSAGFAVLTAPNIPSVLVELGCLSNPVEEDLLQRPDYRRRLARGLAQAIRLYFSRRDVH
jgi:N-acetylmuramoyl-L-alanine amidase